MEHRSCASAGRAKALPGFSMGRTSSHARNPGPPTLAATTGRQSRSRGTPEEGVTQEDTAQGTSDEPKRGVVTASSPGTVTHEKGQQALRTTEVVANTSLNPQRVRAGAAAGVAEATGPAGAAGTAGASRATGACKAVGTAGVT